MANVVFKTCKLFNETLLKHGVKVVKGLDEFRKMKEANPMAPYGSKDYPFRGNGPLNGYGHAGITHDISIIYMMSGRDPHVFKLYGFFTHDESGTGQPANIRKQQKLGKKLDGQSF
jgi:hypothetical protein